MKNELRSLAPFLVPELKLWLLPPDAPSWHSGKPEQLGMPYWAFAWPGGQALARYVLDHPEVVKGKRVVDFGCGGAIEGIAAAFAGAAHVTCVDLDETALELAQRNAALNGVTLTFPPPAERGAVRRGATLPPCDVILAGDVCYSEAAAREVLPLLRSTGARVLLGDPLRVPGVLDDARRLATYDASFDGDVRGLTLWPTHVLELFQCEEAGLKAAGT